MNCIFQNEQSKSNSESKFFAQAIFIDGGIYLF